MITLIAAIQEKQMPPLVSEGLNLALYGMGTVFVFLTLLVLATMLMSWLVTQRETAAVVALPADSAGAKMAAITAAIHQHRNR
jgi:oxaloacetate decarboxylase gamma subunit